MWRAQPWTKLTESEFLGGDLEIMHFNKIPSDVAAC